MSDESPINQPISEDGAATARGLTYDQVREQFPEAWEALPECYQDDSCLTFYLKGNELQADYDLEPITFIWNGVLWHQSSGHKR